MSAIRFFLEEIEFKVPFPVKTKKWITDIVVAEGRSLTGVNYILCSDEYLLEVNREYLNHDYYTDIITFDNSEVEKEIEGDIFISVDRVRDNAKSENTDESTEFRRVLAHGVLHLCGFDDKSEASQQEMRAKEDYYLSKFK
jgi:probable rRNA maturation factor